MRRDNRNPFARGAAHQDNRPSADASDRRERPVQEPSLWLAVQARTARVCMYLLLRDTYSSAKLRIISDITIKFRHVRNF